METDEKWMRRALQLAEYGRGSVSPNPMVGCVIVCDDRIIGEGWHRLYGEAHAEVNAVLDAESKGFGDLLSRATAYVTLEPCSHTGKTPPCADLLIRKKLSKVVVCNMDPNPLVSGRGMDKLRNAGIAVCTGMLEAEGLELNRRFFTSMTAQRPYIILKWAESADGFIGNAEGQPVAISGKMSNQLVHKWRTEEDAILVGYKTAAMDNPQLNVRHWTGTDPVRVVLDRYLKLPEELNLFDGTQPTIIVNYSRSTERTGGTIERYATEKSVAHLKLDAVGNDVAAMLKALLERKIHSVFVEGGTAAIQSFLDSGCWDEIRRCQNSSRIFSGVKAPVPQGTLKGFQKLGNDLWTFYSRN